MFPGAGPVKTQIVGTVTDAVERQSVRIRRDLNYQLCERVVGYTVRCDVAQRIATSPGPIDCATHCS